MAVQFDSTPRAVADHSNVATTLGVGAIGGGIAVRVIVDDAVITSKETALRHLETVMDAITAAPWPVS